MASKIKKKPLPAIIPGNESHRQSEGTATPRHAASALVRRHEDVFRLDVAVRDLVLVEVRERARELPQYGLGARFLDRLLLEDDVEQLSPGGLLHD